MRLLIIVAATLAALTTGGIALASPATAQMPCSNATVWGNGGGRCDSGQAADGSFTRCDTVYVLGIGGTNCYRVDPGAP
jgi:hypothetical protein